jgi:hypothetical protein
MVTVKYVFTILHADNDGEGDTFSTYNLWSRYASLTYVALSLIRRLIVLQMNIAKRDPREASFPTSDDTRHKIFNDRTGISAIRLNLTDLSEPWRTIESDGCVGCDHSYFRWAPYPGLIGAVGRARHRSCRPQNLKRHRDWCYRCYHDWAFLHPAAWSSQNQNQPCILTHIL